jgi:flagellum-specific ATP synthase
MTEAIKHLERSLSSIRSERVIHAVGRVKRFDGQIIHASAFPASVGQECRIYLDDGSWAEAEVIGFLDEYTVLVLTGGKGAIVAGARVETVKRVDLVPCGDGLLGRVFDGAGNVLDGMEAPVLREMAVARRAGQSLAPTSGQAGS